MNKCYARPCEYGWGVFASEDILKGEIFTEYDGNTIDRSEAHNMRRRKRSSHLCSIDYRMLIDGLRSPEKGRGLGSLINHSSHFFNAQFYRSDSLKLARLRDDTRKGHISLTRVWIKATEDIITGKQVLVNYGARYWKADHSCSIGDRFRERRHEKNKFKAMNG